MLKVKDSVDLKVLEDYGFIEDKKDYYKSCGCELMYILKDNRKICLRSCDEPIIDILNTLYLLISNDLVEKVDND